ncbi:MAG: hypothetical protein ABI672_19650, partial [Vicinamibacteria bacterium]
MKMSIRRGVSRGFLVAGLRLLPAVLFLLAANFASAAVTPPTAQATQFTTSSSLTSFAVPAGTDRVLVVTASDPTSPTQPSAVTFNGTPMVFVSQANDGSVASDSIWVLPLGTGGAASGNIAVSFASGGVKFIGASVFDGVHQTTPAVAGPTKSVTTGVNVGSSLVVASAVGDRVYDIFDTFLSSAAATVTPTSGQAPINDGAGAVPSGFGHYVTSHNAGAANVTMSWTSNSEAILHVTMNLKAAPAGAPTPSVTNSVTAVNTQSTTGLVITPNSGSVTHFKIT